MVFCREPFSGMLEMTLAPASFTVLPRWLNMCIEVAIPSEGIPRHCRYGVTCLTIAPQPAFNNRSFPSSSYVELSATFNCVELF